MSKKKILFITYCHWTQAGDSQYSLSFLKDLVNRYSVTVVGPVKPPVQVCHFYKIHMKTGFSWRHLSLGTYSFLKPISYVGNVGNFSFVVIDHLRSYFLLKAVDIGRDIPMVYLSHNWECRNLIENIWISRSFNSVKKAILNFAIYRYEKRLHENSIVVHADFGAKEMRYYPFADEADDKFIYEKDAPIIFVGNLTWYPNVNAIKNYIESFASAVKNNIVLIGKGGSQLKIPLGSENIKRHDFVYDICKMYPKSAGLLVISKGGTGIKLKIINSLGYYLKVYCNEEILESFPEGFVEIILKDAVRIGDLYAFDSSEDLLKLYNKYQKACANVIFEKIELSVE